MSGGISVQAFAEWLAPAGAGQVEAATVVGAGDDRAILRRIHQDGRSMGADVRYAVQLIAGVAGDE
jgi:hypothetical protein